MDSVTIIGGGVSGCLTAKLLSSMGMHVVLLEDKADLFQGASGRNWARLHLGQMSAPYIQMSKDIMQASIDAAPIIQDFLILPENAPKYFIPDDINKQTVLSHGGILDKDTYKNALVELEEYFKALLEKDTKASILPFTRRPFFSEMSQGEVTSELSDPRHSGFRSNEITIDLPRLTASLEMAIRNDPNIEIRTSASMQNLHYKDGVYNLNVKDIRTGKTSTIETRALVNACWLHGPDVDRKLLANSGFDVDTITPTGKDYGAYAYRMQRYGIVSGLTGKRYDYKNILGKYGAGYFQATDDKAVIEVNGLSDLAVADRTIPESWEKYLHSNIHKGAKFGSEDPLLDSCREQFKGMFDTAKFADEYHAAFWVAGNDRSVVGTKSLRNFPEQETNIHNYYPMASEKIPVAIRSAYEVAADIAIKMGNPELSKKLGEAKQHGFVQLRDIMLELPGIRIAPARKEDVYQLRGQKTMSHTTTAESVSAENYAPLKKIGADVVNKGKIVDKKHELE